MLFQREMTAEEFLVYAEQHRDKRFDFIDGEMVEVSPKPVHGRIQMTLGGAFVNYVRDNPIGIVYSEVLHVLNGKKYIPDICINSTTTEDYFTVAPLVAVEIRSDSQSKAAQRKKAVEYLQHGVKLSILIFPGENIEVYFAGRDVKVLTYGDTLDGEDILPNFSIAVDDIL
ncbi:MAG: Uma2 family endonuclease [Chloroflexi bacterium]|nr:Uma2 family endonuclease [Chloroflexota bacterium]MCC6892607.1 Uma2 family endonuclease [Anaerolineae bacterium]